MLAPCKDPAESIVAMIGQLAVLPREEALARVREVVAKHEQAPQAEPSDDDLFRLYEEGVGFEIKHSRSRIIPLLRALLARYGQPAEGVEPVARIYRKGFQHGSIVWTAAGLAADLPDGTELYAAIDAAQAQPKRRPYNASGSLSEHGIPPECDAAPVAQDPAKGVDVALRYNWNEHLIEHNAPEYQHDFILFKVVEAYVLKHLADRQQRGGDALDAARYRWLRKNWQFSLHGQPVWVDIDPDLKPPIDSTTKLDELIDAAMSKEGKQ